MKKEKTYGEIIAKGDKDEKPRAEDKTQGENSQHGPNNTTGGTMQQGRVSMYSAFSVLQLCQCHNACTMCPHWTHIPGWPDQHPHHQTASRLLEAPPLHTSREAPMVRSVWQTRVCCHFRAQAGQCPSPGQAEQSPFQELAGRSLSQGLADHSLFPGLAGLSLFPELAGPPPFPEWEGRQQILPRCKSHRCKWTPLQANKWFGCAQQVPKALGLSRFCSPWCKPLNVIVTQTPCYLMFPQLPMLSAMAYFNNWQMTVSPK